MNNFELIDSIDKLKRFSDKWTSKNFSFDTEFTSLSWMEQNIIGMSIFDKDSLYDPTFIQFNFHDTYTTKEKNPQGGRKKILVEHDYYKTDAIDFEEARPYLEKIFENANCTTANGKVEWKIMSKYDITNWRIAHDTMLMGWLLNVDNLKGLKYNAKKELGLGMSSYEDTIKQKVGNINWNLVDWYEYAKYGAKDAYATELLAEKFIPRFEPFPALWKCYQSLEIPLIYEVANAEMAGVNIDVDYLLEMSEQAGKEIYETEQRIYDSVGVEFNIGSSKQLAEILFNRLKLPVIKVSDKTGARSVDEAVLKELAFRGYDIIDDILEYRTLKKLKTTYIDAIPTMVDKDSRLRGSFNQAGTSTGRFSSSKPNLQNQPNNKKFPIKRAFVPKKGYKFLVYDWSTIEIRIMAHESGDKKMIEVLSEGRDIHQETTDNVNSLVGLNLDRGQGKTINFGVLYLMGNSSLAYMLNKQLRKEFRQGKITRDEYEERFVTDVVAQKIIDSFFDTYTGFAQFVKDETNIAKRDGWVWTLGGRRRPVPELRTKKLWGAGRRKAVNTPIQGGAGDLMKLAILKLKRMYVENGLDAETLLYVHDEFVIEVKEEQAELASGLVKEVMESIFPSCRVPIVCEGGIFDDWAGLKQGAETKPQKARKQATTTNQAIKLLKLKLLN